MQVPARGFLLHVGGNQWYKNRDGLLALYTAYASAVSDPLPLYLLGAAPTDALRQSAARVPPPGEVRFVVTPSSDVLEAAYAAASALVFPSHAEGFGWPILEAMACGCPVLTTDEAPMTEVGGDVASYCPPTEGRQSEAWAVQAAGCLQRLLSELADQRVARREAGFAHVRRFEPGQVLSRYLAVYAGILEGRDEDRRGGREA